MSPNTCCRRARLRTGTAAAAVLALCVTPTPAEATPKPIEARVGGHLPADRLDPFPPLTVQTASSAAVVTLPPSDPRADAIAAVIATAMEQLGDPYRWGGSGPDVFDCSGFTSFAWRAAGVELAHYTGAQLSQTRRVSLEELQPGDLVFFGIGHMGLYIGDGQMIHAPRSGDVVKIDPIDVWRTPTAASRPELVLS